MHLEPLANNSTAGLPVVAIDELWLRYRCVD